MNDVARARAYDLLGSLLLGDRAAMSKARMVAPFDGMLSGCHDAELAAEHYRLFALEAFPYAGVFSEPEALIGGRIADRVAAVLAELELGELGGESADHAGNILRATGGLLCAGKSDDARALVRECLLPWAAPWAAAVWRQRDGFWRFTVELCLSLLGEHLAGASPGSLRLEPSLVVDDAHGIGDIADALTIPAIAGVFITREDIRRLGREHELPTGFGSRRLMLANLLRSAAEYQSGARLLRALSVFFASEASRMETITQQTSGLRAAVGQPWIARAKATATTLSAMALELGELKTAVGYGNQDSP